MPKFTMVASRSPRIFKCESCEELIRKDELCLNFRPNKRNGKYCLNCQDIGEENEIGAIIYVEESEGLHQVTRKGIVKYQPEPELVS